jgi:hypothetical protein
MSAANEPPGSNAGRPTDDYYVYVYIDPRNFEEFYYGKGRGSRKDAHLMDVSGSEKSLRIKAIRDEGLKPLVRVIARNLSEHDAFLVEKTLLWKLGKGLSNISSGHYAENFRPDYKLHVELSGFDFEHGIYYFNVGDGDHRRWVDCKRFGFISAGGVKPIWRRAISGFRRGDVFAAYVAKKGFVGIGKILEPARPIREVTINGIPLLELDLTCRKMDHWINDDDKCQHVALVEWKSAVDLNHAKRRDYPKLYTTALVRASLDAQQETIKFLSEQFEVDFKDLVQ